MRSLLWASHLLVIVFLSLAICVVSSEDLVIEDDLGATRLRISGNESAIRTTDSVIVQGVNLVEKINELETRIANLTNCTYGPTVGSFRGSQMIGYGLNVCFFSHSVLSSVKFIYGRTQVLDSNLRAGTASFTTCVLTNTPKRADTILQLRGTLNTVFSQELSETACDVTIRILLGTTPIGTASGANIALSTSGSTVGSTIAVLGITSSSNTDQKSFSLNLSQSGCAQNTLKIETCSLYLEEISS